MSTGKRLPLEQAREVAARLVRLLDLYCERIEIAGSIRRGKPEVGDIEIVAQPAFGEQTSGDLWGTPKVFDRLDERLTALMGDGLIGPRNVEIHRADGRVENGRRMGRAYKALTFEGMPVDLFLVYPGEADWGVIFAIRTGPGDWNQRLVTDCQRRLRRVEGGRVYRAGAYVPCPEERDFFEAIGQRWIEPSARRVELVEIR